MKLHLEDDLKRRGIIFNREVQIHKRERTDIHVTAIQLGQKKDSYDSITVIIEAKGCWNRELDNAMETQLLGKYLTDNNCKHGMYLVAWFNCDQWDNADYRKKQASNLTVEEAQKKFDIQASQLSNQGKLIKAVILNTALR